MPDDPRRFAAVVLAAGASSRLGRAKQLIEYRGETLVRRAAREGIDAGASVAIVVIGARAAEVRRAVLGMPGVYAVANERWSTGLASSLAVGLREALQLDPACDGALIVAAGQPLVDAGALRLLIDAFDGATRLVAAEYAGTIGAPALIGREHFGALCRLEGDAGAGKWLRARRGEVRAITMEVASTDIDVADDVTRLAALA